MCGGRLRSSSNCRALVEHFFNRKLYSGTTDDFGTCFSFQESSKSFASCSVADKIICPAKSTEPYFFGFFFDFLSLSCGSS